jgi:hypothetical protein
MGDLANKIRAKYPGSYDDMDDAALEAKILAKYPQYGDLAKAAPVAQPAPKPSLGQRVVSDVKQGFKDFGDTVVGAGKGALQSVVNNVDLAQSIGPQRMAEKIAAPEMAKERDKRYEEQMKPLRDATVTHSTRQKVGYGLETAAEFLVPTGSAGNAARPATRMLKAGALIDDAEKIAANVPINITNVGNQALRIEQLAQRGGVMPKVVRNFLTRVLDPEKGPVTFKEARDFYNNASRLTRAEAGRLTAPLRREMVQFTRHMHNSLVEAAEQAGKGDQYASGIKNYASAAKWARRLKKTKQVAIKYGVPGLIGGGAATAGTVATWKALRGD